MNTYEKARVKRNGAAKALAKSLAKRLRKEFPKRKVCIAGRYSEDGREVRLDVFPKGYKGEDVHGIVTLLVLDKNGYRSDLTKVPERLKLGTGYGGTHATYKLKDGVVPTKTMGKLLGRVRSYVEDMVGAYESGKKSDARQAKTVNEARSKLMSNGYSVKGGKLVKVYGEGFCFTAKKSGHAVSVVGSGFNQVKVSLHLERTEHYCRPKTVVVFCDELVGHAEAMEALCDLEERAS